MSSGFFLAGRYVRIDQNVSEFGIQEVTVYNEDYVVNGSKTYLSHDVSFITTQSLRPVISINLNTSGCKITKEEKDGKAVLKLNWE